MRDLRTALLVYALALIGSVAFFAWVVAQPGDPSWDYAQTARQSPDLDPSTVTELVSAIKVSDTGNAFVGARGFAAQIRGSGTYLCVFVPQGRMSRDARAKLGDKVAYVGLAAPIIASPQNPEIPGPGIVDVRYMLTAEQFEDLKRDGISHERLTRLLDEAAVDGWKPLRFGGTAWATVRTIAW